jgi:xanthine/uracil permease
MGCVLTYLLTFQIAAGFATIGQEEKGFRLESGIVVGLPVLMGTAVSMLPARILGTFPPVLRPVIGNGFVIGVLVAFILEHVVYKERKGRAFQE